MGYSYTTINGQRVEKNVAAAFQKMRAAFKEKFGLDLLVSSGTRTRAEQARLYDGWIRRLPGFNLAAPPGSSNHEESGPRGPRALDLRDSGRDAGVTVIGSTRSNWLKANAWRWGFTAAGHAFRPPEGWHYEYTKALAGSGAAPSGGGGKVTTASFGRVDVVQRALKKNYPLYAGTLKVDNQDGPATRAAVSEFQRRSGLKVDGIAGPATRAALGISAAASKPKPAPKPKPKPAGKVTTASFGRVDVVQRALKTRYPLYAGRLVIDNRDGPATRAAVSEFQRRSGLKVDGIAGPATRRALGV